MLELRSSQKTEGGCVLNRGAWVCHERGEAGVRVGGYLFPFFLFFPFLFFCALLLFFRFSSSQPHPRFHAVEDKQREIQSLEHGKNCNSFNNPRNSEPFHQSRTIFCAVPGDCQRPCCGGKTVKAILGALHALLCLFTDQAPILWVRAVGRNIKGERIMRPGGGMR